MCHKSYASCNPERIKATFWTTVTSVWSQPDCKGDRLIYRGQTSTCEPSSDTACDNTPLMGGASQRTGCTTQLYPVGEDPATLILNLWPYRNPNCSGDPVDFYGFTPGLCLTDSGKSLIYDCQGLIEFPLTDNCTGKYVRTRDTNIPFGSWRGFSWFCCHWPSLGKWS